MRWEFTDGAAKGDRALLQAHGIASFKICQIMHPLENPPNNLNVASKVILNLSLLVFAEIRIEITDPEFIWLFVAGFLLHKISYGYNFCFASKPGRSCLAGE